MITPMMKVQSAEATQNMVVRNNHIFIVDFRTTKENDNSLWSMHWLELRRISKAQRFSG